MTAYIALLRKDRRSDFSVEFPDLPGCITAGKTLEEARMFAREALALHLRGLAEDGAAVPAPSALDDLMADPENRDNNTVAFLVDAPPRKQKAVPVTITVSEDLMETVKTKSAEYGMTQSGIFAEGAKMLLKKLSHAADGRSGGLKDATVRYAFKLGRDVGTKSAKTTRPAPSKKKK